MKKIAIVRSYFYQEISDRLVSGALSELNKLDPDKKIFSDYSDFYVSGIYEIPVIISKYINDYDAFIAVGCVIKGKTPHFDFITKSTFDGLINLSIEYKKPIGNGIITALNMKQANERSSYKGKNKGKEAARAIMSVISNPFKREMFDKIFPRKK